MSTDDYTRLNVNINDETAAIIAAHKAEGLSATEQVRRAVSLYYLVHEHVHAGGTVRVVTRTRFLRREKVRELVFRG